MSVEVVRAIERLSALEAEWTSLVRRYPGRTPFSTFEWVSSWLTTLGGDVRLFVVVVKDGTVLRGIAPLCVRDGGLLTFIGYPQNDYADMLVDPACPSALDAIVETLFAYRKEWKKAILDQFHQEGSQWRSLERHLREAGRHHRVEVGDPSPAMMLDDPVAARKKYYKRKIATYVNWYKQRGKLEHEVYTEPSVALDRLESLFEQHVDRWKNTATPSYFEGATMREFYRTFVRTMLPLSWVRITALTLDGHSLAMHLFFEYEKVMYLYKASFDLDYSKRSPGQVILRYLFDYAVHHGVEEIDFARGEEGYKDRFVNVSRWNRRIILYGNPLAKHWASGMYAFRRSRVVDVLYRNRTVQSLKYRLLRRYYRRRTRTA